MVEKRFEKTGDVICLDLGSTFLVYLAGLTGRPYFYLLQGISAFAEKTGYNKTDNSKYV
jgi:hypothetical protein